MQPLRPTRQEHIDQAHANDSLSLRLESTEPDWALTVMFYAPLHWVSAYLATIDFYPGSHQTRRSAIYSRAELRGLRDPYFFLKDQSEDARYDCTHFSAEDVARFRVQNYAPIAAEALYLIDPENPRRVVVQPLLFDRVLQGE